MQALQKLCQVLEQPYGNQQKVYIHTATREEADLLDRLLWTYREDSFLAHELQDNADANTPIVIGINAEPESPRDILLNLHTEIPTYINNFSQVFEFIFKDPVVEQQGRERYRKYREQGFELNTHKLKAN